MSLSSVRQVERKTEEKKSPPIEVKMDEHKNREPTVRILHKINEFIIPSRSHISDETFSTCQVLRASAWREHPYQQNSLDQEHHRRGPTHDKNIWRAEVTSTILFSSHIVFFFN